MHVDEESSEESDDEVRVLMTLFGRLDLISRLG